MSWLLDHSVDPELARRAGVTGTVGGPINFLYSTPNGERFIRTRYPNGKVLQPKGQGLTLYWPLGRIQGGYVLLTEGEGDCLCAATIIERSDISVCPVGMPGAGAVKVAAAELSECKVKRAYICLDGDEAGVRATNKLQELLPRVGIEPWPIWLPENYDLSDWIKRHRPHDEALRSLLRTAMHQACHSPQKTTKAVRTQQDASEGMLRGIQARVYVSALAEIEEPREGVLINCPLHEDRTPSFRVNGNLYFCFGCQSGGGIFDFGMALWDCDFKTAVTRLEEEFQGVAQR